MFTSVAQANDAVIERIRNARPHWLDVQPAGSLIEALNKNRTLLHAGPPMRWQEMTGPMKGACVGACLFEGWAQVLIKKALNLKSGSGEPNKKKVAKMTSAQVREIAELKMPDLNAASVEAAMSMIAGTARSMGVVIED